MTLKEQLYQFANADEKLAKRVDIFCNERGTDEIIDVFAESIATTAIYDAFKNASKCPGETRHIRFVMSDESFNDLYFYWTVTFLPSYFDTFYNKNYFLIT